MKFAHSLSKYFLAAALLSSLAGQSLLGAERQEINLSGPGWKLWYDAKAEWKNDELFPLPVNLSKLPTNAPTGGWAALDSDQARDAAVPGTAEEYLQKTPGPEGDIVGVSWWVRTLEIPEATAPRHMLLRFESVRQRAEVYVNQKLVGYDLIGNTPFEVDLSDVAKPGDRVQLAVRITDPGGNFDWHDKGLIDWGKNQILLGHGFGGITGRVKLLVTDPVYVDDIYVQNTPAMTDVNIETTLRNTTAQTVHRNIGVTIRDKQNADQPLATEQKEVELAPGANVVRFKVSCPQAKLWDPDHPNLYICEAKLSEVDASGNSASKPPNDAAQKTFGFRWFEPVDIGKQAMFRLNGKRIVLRSAISWGFFPINGLYATDEIAERQIRVAKQLGLNMLNFHRAIGQPIILEKADELGLLYYEEPGNYDNGALKNEGIARSMAREKVLRMVQRDRSHPSLIIYSMSNETGPTAPALANYAADMKAMHALDPSRLIVRSSGLRSIVGIENEASTKWHYRPFDDQLYTTGWYDDHHAGGPAVYTQSAYKNPKEFYHLINDPQEINFWGEEGALSTPPRLGLIKHELETAPNLGWDGAMYLAWYKMFDEFLTAKNLRSTFPTVDALCQAMGNISLEHQGRTIELIRINNDADAYCINGWEGEILENHSGVVDCFRNPKGDPAIMAYYNQPLYIAVMVRNQIVRPTGKVIADFYLVNEKNIQGPYQLQITAEDSAGKQTFAKSVDVSVAGGDTYGQLLVEGIEIPLNGALGKFQIRSTLIDSTGQPAAVGHDEIFSVDWKSAKLAGAGSVLDPGIRLRQFLVREKGAHVENYSDNLPHLDWIVAAQSPNASAFALVPETQLRDSTASRPGLAATFFSDQEFTTQVHSRTDATIDLFAAEGAPPDPAVPALGNYAVRWEGQILPPASGSYSFAFQGSGTASVTVDGKLVYSGVGRGSRASRSSRGSQPATTTSTLQLESGKPVPIKVEWHQATGDAECRLLWTVPAGVERPSSQKLIDRVRNDGSTLIVLENAPEWLELAKSIVPEIKYDGSFRVGTTWAGGVHFVRQHPLFKDLPTGGGMDWPYQAVVRDGNSRSGLLLTGDDLAAGAFHSNTPLAMPPAPINLGTAVGVVPCGKGKIIVSTLDILGNLAGPEGPADVARKLLCNYIEFANQK
ncbi:MAG TPA: PA14 domain-containing protein [Pirellulales bacterium]|nr:PA14 domain-containing protein [Pirellulales bacterium]